MLTSSSATRSRNSLVSTTGCTARLRRSTTAWSRSTRRWGGPTTRPLHPARWWPTTNQDVVKFAPTCATSPTMPLVVGRRPPEQRFEDVKRVIERFRGRDGHTDADKAWTWPCHRRAQLVRVLSLSGTMRRTRRGALPRLRRQVRGQKEKLVYTILAASLAYQFGLEWGAVRSRTSASRSSMRRSPDAPRGTRSGVRQARPAALIVTPLQKVHHRTVRAGIGFVDNPDSQFAHADHDH